MTQAAWQSHIGDWAGTFLEVAILLFAFSSVIGNYCYGKTNIEFLNGNKSALFIYRKSCHLHVGSINKWFKDCSRYISCIDKLLISLFFR
ncbi:alanine:cation symporter family protein [Bacillus sp. F19]|nr:alanine:cation symporter family protein [Bacillus sp. F19]